MPLYLYPLLLIELLWVIGMGIHFVRRRRRERLGTLRAVAGWGTLVVLAALSSHAAFRLVPPRLIYPAVALIILGSLMAPAAGAFVAGFFRKQDTLVLSIVTLSMLLIIYGTGWAAGISYEESSYRWRCAGHLGLIHSALERYQEDHGDYPTEERWISKIRGYMKDGDLLVRGYMKDGNLLVCPGSAIRSPDPRGVRYEMPIRLYRYHYVSWRDAEDEAIQVSCHHPAGMYLPEETLAITFGGKIARK
jgi:hypothetical protein